MTLVSIPANPVPEDVVSGTIKTLTAPNCGRALAPPAGRKGTVALHRAQRGDREIFETVRTCAIAALRGDDRLARPGSFVAAPARSAKGYVRDFSDFEVRRPNLRAAGGAAGFARRPISLAHSRVAP